MYLKEKTPAQERQDKRELSVLVVAEALNHLASQMKSQHQKYWSVEPIQLVEDLNADLADSLEVMAGNTEVGLAVNKQLDELNLPQFSKRVPLVIGNPLITFDGEQFVYTEPEVEEDIT